MNSEARFTLIGYQHQFSTSHLVNPKADQFTFQLHPQIHLKILSKFLPIPATTSLQYSITIFDAIDIHRLATIHSFVLSHSCSHLSVLCLYLFFS